MIGKEIKLADEARKAIKAGIDAVADAVRTTLGPKGNCVVIGDYSMGKPHVTKDGVTVAKSIDFTDPWKNTGAQLIKEAAIRTVNLVGDSTTTSTVLAQSLINGAENALKTGANPVMVKKGMEIAGSNIIKYIDKVAKNVEPSDYEKIATISANNDVELGKTIGDIFVKVGADGVVIAEESKDTTTTVEVIEGMQFDKGYIAQHFVTDTVKDTCVLEKPHILITEHKILSTKDLLQIIEPIAKAGESLLLIAEKYDDAVVEAFKLSKLNGNFKSCLVECPSWGNYRKAFLQDIAVMTGGTCITYDSGMEIRQVELMDLGRCEKAIITKNSTTLIDCYGELDAVKERIMQLKNEYAEIEKEPGMDGSFMLDFIKQRIAKMASGIGKINVGGATEMEIKERKDRVDDAICATKAAIEEGYVIGGGMTYINAARENANMTFDNSDMTIGYGIVINSLYSPFMTILENCGEETLSFMDVHDNIGYDANTEKICDLVEAGIIDPAKAVKLAFKNALSVAELYLSTSAVIVPEIGSNLVTI